MPRPKFEKGREKTGGREKGTENKLTTDIKQFYIDILNHVKMNGLEGAAAVFSKNDRNKIAFYQIISKMLPTNMTVDGDVSHFVYQISEQFLPKDEKKGKKEDITTDE